jgi:hypothetical protein
VSETYNVPTSPISAASASEMAATSQDRRRSFSCGLGAIDATRTAFTDPPSGPGRVLYEGTAMKTLTTSVIAIALVVLMLPHAASAQSALTVSELSVATNVVDRMPSGVATTFRADVERVYAWSLVEGAAGETTLHHVWIQGDVERADLELRVGGSPWRTWSNKAIPPEWSGNWRVEVRDANGAVLDTVRFTVGG